VIDDTVSASLTKINDRNSGDHAMYRAVTGSIEVSVVPRYLSGQSDPDENRFVWSYTITIVNNGEEAVQLRSRFWRITDESGITQEVRGAGVVGEQPVIQPGGRYEYTSGCPLTTSSGVMVGSYQMVSASGTLFSVDIPAFSLDSPHAQRSVN
jgi:ApaG protein